jgi:hypothetical protein
MRIGSPLHVMRTSSSLNPLMPSFMKTETMSSSDVFPTLIRDVEKSWNVAACLIVQIAFKRELADVFDIACAPICNPDLPCGGSQDREACFALVMFADVVSVDPRVICQHDTRG